MVASNGLAERLRSTELWKAQETALDPRIEIKVLKLLDAMDRRPRLSPTECTEATGVREHQIPGFVAQVSRVLNVDGEEVIRWDGQERRILLDRELLSQIFGVPRGGA